MANTQSRALRVKCPVNGELSPGRKNDGIILRCRTRIPLFHNEEELTSLLSLQPNLFDTGVFALSLIIEGFLFYKNTLLFPLKKGGFFMSEKQISTTHKLVLMAMMVAANVVLSRFLSISLWNLKIGFAFVPVVLTAMLLGPIPAGIVGAAADFIGATLFPIGAYFPGFTFTGFLVGVCYGIFLHKKQDIKGIFMAVLLSECIGSILLNTLWISILYGAPFIGLLPARVMQAVGMGIVEVILIRLLANYVPQLKKTL